MPEAAASVTLFGATTPFHAFTLSDDSGRFTFKKLEAGTYTLAIYIPARGEARQTVEVGPGTSDGHGRVQLRLALKDSDFVYGDIVRQEHAVSTRELTIPDKALHDYQEARKSLGKRDTASAVAHLEHAVEIAPQFSAAWNELGTINYQTQNFARAEECFRRSLEMDPKAYEPLVNLGGVLVTLQKLDEAWKFNALAVLERPGDALANSQMGMTYFGLGDFDHAIKYLEKARRIDPRPLFTPAVDPGRDPPPARRTLRRRRVPGRLSRPPPRLASGRQNARDHRGFAETKLVKALPCLDIPAGYGSRGSQS